MIRFFLGHPTAANLLMLVFLALGLFSLNQVKREAVPDIPPAEVLIRFVYPGASPEEVESAVVEPVEQALEGISYLQEMRSESLENRALIQIKMASEGHFPSFRSDIDQALQSLENLPESLKAPVIETVGSHVPVLSVLLGGNPDIQALANYAEHFRRRLLQLPGVSRVKLEGFGQDQLQIQLKPEVLRHWGLSVSQVAQAIQRQSLNLPMGTLSSEEQEYLLRLDAESRNPAALAELIVLHPPAGTPVRLGDLAEIRQVFADPEQKITLKGERVVRLQVQKSRQDDVLRVRKGVLEAIAAEQARLGDTLQLHLSEDAAKGLNSQLTLVISNGIQGLILVFLTMWLFFSAPVAFWMAMSLPVSFLGAAFVMPWLNLSVNTMSLIGLLLALGLLMDDAIVLTENMIAHLQKGKKPWQAALEGVNEVKIGVVYSFLTTLGVLGPLALIQGDIGKQLAVVPLVLILVMAVSLIEAFLILPAHLRHSLASLEKTRQKPWRQQVDRAMDWIRYTLIARVARLAVRFRYLFTGSVLAVFLIAAGWLLSGRLPFVALPPLEGDVLIARLRLPQGSSLAQTEKAVEQLLKGLEATNLHYRPQQPDQSDLVQLAAVNYGQNTDSGEQGSHVATLVVDLLAAEKRVGRLDAYIEHWRAQTGQIAGLSFLSIGEPSHGAAGRAIHIRLQGTETEQLYQAGLELKQWLARYQGVSNLNLDFYSGKPMLQMQLKPDAQRFGLSTADIAKQVNAAYLGAELYHFQSRGRDLEVVLSLNESAQQSLSSLEDFFIITADGQLVPLQTLADFRPLQNAAVLRRVDGLRTLTLYGDVDVLLNNTQGIVSALQQDFWPELQSRYPGLKMHFEGEIKEAGTTRGSMLSSLLLGLLAVFFLLSFQFRSYLEPLIVMLVIPLTLIGVIGGHVLLAFPFSMPGLLGVIALSGIVVNDSLLLVEFIKLERGRGRGQTVIEAAVAASQNRFRAIFLTSATTIAGLLPMLLERSLQAQILRGLIISVSFGLLVTTFLVLLLIPALYAILDDFGLTAKVSADAEA